MNKVNWKSKSTWIIVFSLLCNFILGCAVYTYYDQSVQQQRDYNALQEQHELLQKNTSELNNKIDVLQSQLDETQPTIDELQSQLSSLTSENTSLKAQIETLTNERNSLQQKLNSQQSSNASSTSSSASTYSESSSVGQGETVYITASGKKYHNAGCRYLKKSKIAISLSDAKRQGYTACSVCGG